MILAKCMGCGNIHQYYRFSCKQMKLMQAPMYVLWCENCGTRMHEPFQTGLIESIKIWFKNLRII